VYLSHYTGKMPQSIFSFVSQNKHFFETSALLEFVSGQAKKKSVGEFIGFASFKGYMTILVKRISLEKGVKKTK